MSGADDCTPRYMTPEEHEAWEKAWNIGGKPLPFNDPIAEAVFWREWATVWLPMFLENAIEKGWREEARVVRAEIAEAWAHGIIPLTHVFANDSDPFHEKQNVWLREIYS